MISGYIYLFSVYITKFLEVSSLFFRYDSYGIHLIGSLYSLISPSFHLFYPFEIFLHHLLPFYRNQNNLLWLLNPHTKSGIATAIKLYSPQSMQQKRLLQSRNTNNSLCFMKYIRLARRFCSCLDCQKSLTSLLYLISLIISSLA